MVVAPRPPSTWAASQSLEPGPAARPGRCPSPVSESVRGDGKNSHEHLAGAARLLGSVWPSLLKQLLEFWRCPPWCRDGAVPSSGPLRPREGRGGAARDFGSRRGLASDRLVSLSQSPWASLFRDLQLLLALSLSNSFSFWCVEYRWARLWGCQPLGGRISYS